MEMPMIGMVVIMGMPIAMAMGMIVIIPAMTMPAAIGPSLGLERRLLVANLHAQAFKHMLQHMVLLQQDPANADLQRNMAIAEVIGGAHQIALILRGDQGNRFLRRDDLDDPPIRRAQPVAAAQHRPAFDRQRRLGPRFERHPQPAFLPPVEWQNQPVVRWSGAGDAFGDGE